MEISKDKKTALLFGIDTVIGGYCLEFLLNHGAYKKILVFSNKEISLEDDKVEVLLIDFDRVNDFADLMLGNDLFYCTSSFLQKTTSDFQPNTSSVRNAVPVIKVAAANGVNQIILLSNALADPEALIPTYRLRGQLEEAVKNMSFWAVHIFKPMLLIGEPPNSRWGEKMAGILGKGLDFLTGGLVSKYRPVEADIVAKAMVNSAQRFDSGVHIYPSKLLQDMADEYDRDAPKLG